MKTSLQVSVALVTTLCFMNAMAQSCETNDLRVISDVQVAPTVELAELDWLAFLERRVKEADRKGLFRDAQKRSHAQFKAHVARPSHSTLVMKETAQQHTLPLMPSEVLQRLSVAVRSLLQTVQRTYVLINADDSAQRAWAAQFLAQSESSVGLMQLVMVEGSFIEASRFFQTNDIRVYADQGGVLQARFALQQVPSVVRVHWSETEKAMVATVDGIDKATVMAALSSDQSQ